MNENQANICKRCHEEFKLSDRIGFIRVDKDFWISYHLDGCEPKPEEQ